MRNPVLVCLLCAFLAVPAAAQVPPPAPGPVITVTGEGAVDLPPDMATIRTGVVTQARTAAEALDANSAAMAEVLTLLREAGIAERDLQTSGLSLMPLRDDRSGTAAPPPVRFVARNGVTVRVRDLATLGPVLDRVVQGGANTFDGLDFGLADPAAALAEARLKAVADARLKAETYAGAAGLGLGPVQLIADQSGFVQPMEIRMAASAMDAVPIAAGEVSVRASVTMTWTLAP